MFDYGSYGYIAEKDLATASQLFTAKNYSVSAVYCHQCLEKIAKHYHQSFTLNSRISDVMRSHKLRMLYREIDQKEVRQLVKEIQELTDCYFDTRYPGENYFEVTYEEAAGYLEGTEQLFKLMCLLIEQRGTVELDDMESTKEF